MQRIEFVTCEFYYIIQNWESFIVLLNVSFDGYSFGYIFFFEIALDK